MFRVDPVLTCEKTFVRLITPNLNSELAHFRRARLRIKKKHRTREVEVVHAGLTLQGYEEQCY